MRALEFPLCQLLADLSLVKKLDPSKYYFTSANLDASFYILEVLWRIKEIMFKVVSINSDQVVVTEQGITFYSVGLDIV